MAPCKQWLAVSTTTTCCCACRVSTGGSSLNFVLPAQAAHCRGSDCDYNNGMVSPGMPLTYGGQLAAWSGPGSGLWSDAAQPPQVSGTSGSSRTTRLSSRSSPGRGSPPVLFANPDSSCRTRSASRAGSGSAASETNGGASDYSVASSIYFNLL